MYHNIRRLADTNLISAVYKKENLEAEKWNWKLNLKCQNQADDKFYS